MIEQQLRTDIMHGIGEIPMRHWPTFTNEYKGYPADGSIALRIYDYVKFAHDFTAAGFPAVAGSWFRGNHARAGRVFQDMIASPEAPAFEGPTLAASQYVVALLEAAKQLPCTR